MFPRDGLPLSPWLPRVANVDDTVTEPANATRNKGSISPEQDGSIHSSFYLSIALCLSVCLSLSLPARPQQYRYTSTIRAVNRSVNINIRKVKSNGSSFRSTFLTSSADCTFFPWYRNSLHNRSHLPVEKTAWLI